MGALAGIFGALSGLAGSANDLGATRQQNAEQAMRQQIAQQRQQQFQLAQQEAQQRIATERQRLTAAQQPVPLGQSFTHGGKEYQRFQDPLTNKVTVEELPGGPAETEPEKMTRGLQAIGISPSDANDITVKKLLGTSKAQHKETNPDPNSPTGFSDIYFDSEGHEVWRAATLPPARDTPKETDSTSTDPFGLKTERHTVTKPLINGSRFPAPTFTLPSAAPSGASGSGSKPAKAPSSSGGGPVSVGTYKGLDSTGHIPDRPNLNPQIVQMANDILDGRDVTKIQPAKARGAAESLARAYGWKGQGSLTPAQQMQIEQVDNSLAVLSNKENLKLFDSPWAMVLSTMPIDPTTEGGAKGLAEAQMRKAIPQEYASYLDSLIRLRGVISGIRGFTGANNSNATAERLLAELPNFTNTKNSKDAAEKLSKLRQEISIIKRLGYFRPDESGSTSTAQPQDGVINVTPEDLNQ